MENLRIKFDKEILKEIFLLIKKHTTLLNLSKKLNVDYRSLKRWKAGGSTIPLNYFNSIKGIFPEISKFEELSVKLPRYWGQSEGAKYYIKNLNDYELKKRMKYIREFKQKNNIKIVKKKVNLRENIYKKEIIISIDNNKLLEFYGILMGDGCLSKFLNDGYLKKSITISGNSKKDLEYFQNYLIPLIKDLFKIETKIKFRKHVNCIDIYFLNQDFFDYLADFGFPVGKKGQISIPESINYLPKEKLNHLIRGIFDTDGCISARKDEGYKYPQIVISSSSEPLKLQLKDLLVNQGFPVYLHNFDLRIKGNKNFKKWFDLIGSNNPRNINKYKEWLETCKIIPKTGL